MKFYGGHKNHRSQLLISSLHQPGLVYSQLNLTLLAQIGIAEKQILLAVLYEMHTYLLIILSCSRFQHSVLAENFTLKVGATGCEVANSAIKKVMACNIFSKADNYIPEKVR